MAKTTDVPTELKPFNSVFNKLAYKYDVSQVFDDLLTIIICCMCYQQQEPLYFQTIKKYEAKELNYFAQLFAELMKLYNKAEICGDWIDPLGDYYEVLASNYKKSRLGQFFTPKPICDLMSMLTLNKDNFGATINEPTCGSGRIILASNNFAPGNYYICQDLDPICCKMTAINCCFHTVRAEIHCMNSLTLSKPTASYYINYEYWKHQTKYIILKN